MQNLTDTLRTQSEPQCRSPLAQPSLVAQNVPALLAPAGGPQQFLAALYSGADAVYLGLPRFNARARADNFDPERLRAYLNLAHTYGMKVLVTVNILIKDTEIPAIIDTLATLDELEVDAIIVQDLGVAALARAQFPNLRLHASTQLAVHNLDGVKAAAELGFKRVVLARELTALEIRSIVSASRDWGIETEVFCHGSLCYAYSGLCFFSGAEDARSGNRGECAYTCRKPYRIVSEEGQGYLFSMKDLNTLHDLQTLVGTGVHTLKIEGRKKDAQYVATTVRAYRARLDQLMGHPTLRESAPKSAHTVSQNTQESGETMLKLEKELGYTFRREETSFFLKGRYRENVIDLENPTHRGHPVGIIEAVGNKRARILGISEELRLFDGLRIESVDGVSHESRYHNELSAFSLRGLWDDRGRSVFTSPTGSSVWIELPEGASTEVQVGDQVFKTRSAALKEEIEKLSQTQSDDRLRPLRRIDVSVVGFSHNDGTYSVSATVLKRGVPIVSATERVAQSKPSSGASTLKNDLRSSFRIFGDEGYVAGTIDLEGDFSWFFPRSLIKGLKRRIAAELPQAYAGWLEECRSTAHTWASSLPVCQVDAGTRGTGRPGSAAGADLTAAPTLLFQVKSDRLESLTAACRVASEGISKGGRFEWKLSELTFEPKRHLHPQQKPSDLIAAALKLARSNGIPLRLAVPTVLRAWDLPVFCRLLEAARDAGVRAFEIPGIGALELLRRAGFEVESLDLTTDFTAFSLNRLASREWARLGATRVTLSIEDDFKNLSSHLRNWAAHAQPEVILFKDTPLFIAESCTLTALHNGCPTSAVCGYRSLEIEDEAGERFHVAHESCKSIVYGERPYAISDRVEQLADCGVKHFRVDFLTKEYGADAIQTVLEHCTQGQRISGSHPANFNRTLL